MKESENKLRIVNMYEEVSLVRGFFAIIFALLVFFLTVYIFPLNPKTTTIQDWALQKSTVKTVEKTTIETDCLENNGILLYSGNCKIKNISDQQVTINLGNENQIRIDANTELAFAYSDDATLFVSSESEEGKIWIANSFTNHNVVFSLGKLVVRSSKGNLGIEWNSELAKIFVFGGLVRADLYENFNFSSGDNLVLNSFFIPPYNQAEILYSRINANVAKLYYSKLIKDFGLAAVSDNDLAKNAWLKNNTFVDTDLLFRKRNDFKKLVANMVATTPAYISNDFLYSFSKSFTFSKIKIEELKNRKISYLIADLGEAVLERNPSKEIVVNTKIKEFLQENDLINNAELFSQSLNLWQEALTISVGDEALSEFKDKLKLSFSDFFESDSVFSTILEKILLTYRLSEINIEESKRVVVDLNVFIKNSLEKITDGVLRENLSSLRSIRNLLDTLISRKAFFLEKKYFEGLIYLNSLIVDLEERIDYKEEEIQFAIQTYLRIASRVVTLLKQDNLLIDPEFGRQILLEIDKLEPEKLSDAAVNSFFIEEKERLMLDLNFLSSSAYSSLKKQDFTDNEYELAKSEFERLSKERDRLLQILGQNEIAELAGQTELSAQNTRNAATSILRANGIDFEVLEPDENNPRNVYLTGGRYGNISFSGFVDVRTEFFYDLKVDNKIISTGIRVSDLPQILAKAENLIKAEELPNNNGVSVSGVKSDLNQVNVLEAVLIKLASDRLAELGYFSIGSISLFDSENEIVAVSNLLSQNDFQVFTKYDLKKNQFFDIRINEEAIAGIFDFKGFEQLLAQKNRELREREISASQNLDENAESSESASSSSQN